jgi:predicted RNA binding protein YcfA (HicA-like mRNA interferase family)
MGKYEKLLLQILCGSSDRNIPFEDLCKLLENIGFEKRIRGSHHMFSKDGVEELINLQRMGDKAKDYQIRQVRQIIVRNHIAGE